LPSALADGQKSRPPIGFSLIHARDLMRLISALFVNFVRRLHLCSMTENQWPPLRGTNGN